VESTGFSFITCSSSITLITHSPHIISTTHQQPLSSTFATCLNIRHSSSCPALGIKRPRESCYYVSWTLASKPNGVKSLQAWAPVSPASLFGMFPGSLLPDDFVYFGGVISFPLLYRTIYFVDLHLQSISLQPLSSLPPTSILLYTITTFHPFSKVSFRKPIKMPFTWTPETERTLLLVAISQGNVQPGGTLWDAMIQALSNDVTVRAVRY
jgi:hypothetical protein